MIAVAAAAVGVVGVVAAAAWLWLGPGLPLGGDWLLLARMEGPQFAVVFLAVSAVVVLLLTTATVAADLMRVRFHLEDFRPALRREWIDAFAGTSLRRLAGRLLDLAPEEGTSGLLLQSRFDAPEARREIRCLHRDWLLRAQFVTAFGLLAVIAALGVAQDYGHATLYGFLVPTGLGLGVLALLVLLFGCAWLVVTAMTEPFIDTVAGLPLPRVELRQLQALSALANGERGNARAASTAGPLALERLAVALHEDRDTLRDAVARLSNAAVTLAQAAQTIAERRTPSREAAADPAATAQLQEAITALAAAIERMPAVATQPPADAASPSAELPRRRRGGRRSDLGSELRRLISEFD
jgi:hypothetical protein